MKYRYYYCFPKPGDYGKGYYGKIPGMEDVGIFEADTLEEFEEEFHRIVDIHISDGEKKRNGKGRRFVVGVVVVLVVLTGMLLTCPDKEMHIDSLEESAINIAKGTVDPSTSGLEALGLAIYSPIVRTVIDYELDVRDKLLFSVGTVSTDKGRKTISVGVFNHIFKETDEELQKDLKLFM